MPKDLEQILNNVEQQMKADQMPDAASARNLFVNQLKNITDYFQELRQRDSIGRRKMVGKEEKDTLIRLYQNAMLSARNAAKTSDYNSVHIITEVRDILSRDLKTIQEAMPEENLSIDDTLDRARTETVVVTDDNIKTAGANMSVRIPLSIQGKKGETISGFFTQETKVHTEKSFFELFSKLGEDNPDFEQFAREFYASAVQKTPQNYKGREGLYFGQILEERSQELDLRLDVPLNLAKDPDMRYALALETFYKEKRTKHIIGDFKNPKSMFMSLLKNQKLLKTALDQAGMYMSQLGAQEGSSIDKRNTAMTKVAELLGVGNLIAHSSNMDVIVNGQKVSGTFMADAKGLDIARKPKDHPAYHVPVEQQSGAGFKDVCDLQVLDYICGNVDRHGANVLYQFDENGMFTGVQGIDNDASFGTVVLKDSKGMNRMAGPYEMPFISKSMAEAIQKIRPEELRFALEGNGLNDRQMDAAVIRLSNMKEALIKGKGPTVIDDAEFKNKSAKFFIDQAQTKGPQSLYTFTEVSKQLSKMKAPVNLRGKIEHTKAVQGVLSEDVLNKSIDYFQSASKAVAQLGKKQELQQLIGENGQNTMESLQKYMNSFIKYNQQLKENPDHSMAAVRAAACASTLIEQSQTLSDVLGKMKPTSKTKKIIDQAKAVFDKITKAAKESQPVFKEAAENQNKKLGRTIDQNAADLAKAMEKISKMSEFQSSIYQMDEKGRPVMVKNGQGKRVPAIKTITTPEEALKLSEAIKGINRLMKENGPEDPSNSTGQILIRDALHVFKASATDEFDPMKLSGLTRQDLNQCRETMQKGLTASHETDQKQQETASLADAFAI